MPPSYFTTPPSPLVIKNPRLALSFCHQNNVINILLFAPLETCVRLLEDKHRETI